MCTTHFLRYYFRSNSCSFPYESRIPSYKGSCNRKRCALSSKFNVSFFFVVIWYPLLKSRHIEVKPRSVLSHALMMKKSELLNSRIYFLHQNARSLAGQHLLSKELIQVIGYNCIYAYSKTRLSQNHPEGFWHVNKEDFEFF